MPVYLFTFHAYRSWNADNPRGFVQRDKGILPPNQALARAYDKAAGAPPTLFGEAAQRALLWIGYDVCLRHSWRLHYAATEPTHVHYLVSWRDELAWQEISRRLKNVASLVLGQKRDAPGRRWFSRGASRKRISDRQHLDHLVSAYLPKHGGLSWQEDDPPPIEPPPKEPPASAGGYSPVEADTQDQNLEPQ